MPDDDQSQWARLPTPDLLWIGAGLWDDLADKVAAELDVNATALEAAMRKVVDELRAQSGGSIVHPDCAMVCG